MKNRRPLLLFYNEFWTTFSRGVGGRTYYVRLLSAFRHHPSMVPNILLWPLASRHYRRRRKRRSDLLVRSVGADLSGEASFRVTTKRRHTAKADIVVFHTPTLALDDLPEKEAGQIWVSLSGESEINYPLMENPRYLDLIDYTIDHRRSADIWAPYLPNDDAVKRLQIPVGEKSATAPAMMMVSSNANRSGRLQYATELMTHLPVHSYGRQLNNRALEKDSGRNTKLETASRYKFLLAFENARTPDYVTEKFYDGLLAGSVPVYLGAPNIEDYAPGDDCFINVDDFAGPRELASFLMSLDRDDQAYDRYFAWKNRPLRAEFLRMGDLVRDPPLLRLLRDIQTHAQDP